MIYKGVQKRCRTNTFSTSQGPWTTVMD